jgi:hypothetical protein
MTRPDVSAWTDDELCRELAARATNGETRVPAQWHHLVQAEYDRRAGVASPPEVEVFNRLRDRLRSTEAEVAISREMAEAGAAEYENWVGEPVYSTIAERAAAAIFTKMLLASGHSHGRQQRIQRSPSPLCRS